MSDQFGNIEVSNSCLAQLSNSSSPKGFDATVTLSDIRTAPPFSRQTSLSQITEVSMQQDGTDTVMTSSTTPSEADEKVEVSAQSLCEEFFYDLVKQPDEDGSIISDPFRALPAKQTYPSYYEVIKQPLDLRIVAQRILSANPYPSLNELDADIALIAKNAMRFNETNSEIYRRAQALRRFAKTRKDELSDRARNPPKTSERQKSKRSAVFRATIVEFAAPLRDGFDESEREGERERGASGSGSSTTQNETDAEGGADTAGDDDATTQSAGGAQPPSGASSSGGTPNTSLLSTLVEYIRTYRTPQGELLAEPFLKLPSKAVYKDYYEEIERPISLATVGKKLKQGDYRTLDDLAADLETMFENAKQYNRPDSNIYKHAVRLQKAAQTRLAELKASGAAGGSGGGLASPGSKNQEPVVNPVRIKITANAKKEKYSLVQSPSSSRRRAKRERDAAAASGSASASKRSSESGGATNGDAVALRKRLLQLFSTVYDYRDSSGRHLREIFLDLPSQRDYPDYYKVVTQPIDLRTIRRRIDESRYRDTDELIADLKLMFKNARTYNEDTSQVYCDADALEQALMRRVVALTPLNRARSESAGDGASGTANDPDSPKKRLRLTPAEPRTSIKEEQITNEPLGSPTLSFAYSASPHATLEAKLKDLYDTVKDFADERGRVLSTPFLRLPTKQELPEYYEAIRRPIDMNSIQQKLSARKYDSLDDLLNDFALLFDNACRFNEPESLIYRDALALLNVSVERRRQLTSAEESGVSDVRAAVDELLRSIVATWSALVDADGRAYIDTFDELLLFERDPRAVRMLQLALSETPHPECTLSRTYRRVYVHQVRANVDRGRYVRLDRLQQDLFDALRFARLVAPPGSQLHADAIELHRQFLRVRDVLSQNGDRLTSPALAYSDRTLAAELAEEHNDRNALLKFFNSPTALPTPLSDEDADGESPPQPDADSDSDADDNATDDESATLGSGSQSCVVNGERYAAGDFVLVRSFEQDAGACRVAQIIEFGAAADSSGAAAAAGVVKVRYYVTPAETMHVSTRKFLPNEVLRTSLAQAEVIDTSLLNGHCLVLGVRDFVKQRNRLKSKYAAWPLFVCESRYALAHVRLAPDGSVHVMLAVSPPPADSQPIAEFRKLPPHALRLARARRRELFKSKKTTRQESGMAHAQHLVRTPSTHTHSWLLRVDERTYVADDVHAPLARLVGDVIADEKTDERYIQLSQVLLPDTTGTDSRRYKVGDHVYVNSAGPVTSDETPGEQCTIVRIDKLMRERQSGNVYFLGPRFLFPIDIDHSPSRLFIANEVFISSSDHVTYALAQIVRRCAVLGAAEYVRVRPTEVTERDVYYCDAKYFELEHAVRKLKKGLKKFHVGGVLEDELLVLPSAVRPPRVVSPLVRRALVDGIDSILERILAHDRRGEPSNEDEQQPRSATKAGAARNLKLASRESLSNANQSEASNSAPIDIDDILADLGSSAQNAASHTTPNRSALGLANPNATSSGRKQRGNPPSGYVMFAGEFRKTVKDEHPDKNFGEISRVIGRMWRDLPDDEKAVYERRAKEFRDDDKDRELRARRKRDRNAADKLRKAANLNLSRTLAQSTATEHQSGLNATSSLSATNAPTSGPGGANTGPSATNAPGSQSVMYVQYTQPDGTQQTGHYQQVQQVMYTAAHAQQPGMQQIVIPTGQLSAPMMHVNQSGGTQPMCAYQIVYTPTGQPMMIQQPSTQFCMMPSQQQQQATVGIPQPLTSANPAPAYSAYYQPPGPTTQQRGAPTTARANPLRADPMDVGNELSQPESTATRAGRLCRQLANADTYIQYINQMRKNSKYISNWPLNLLPKPADCVITPPTSQGASDAAAKAQNGQTSNANGQTQQDTDAAAGPAGQRSNGQPLQQDADTSRMDTNENAPGAATKPKDVNNAAGQRLGPDQVDITVPSNWLQLANFSLANRVDSTEDTRERAQESVLGALYALRDLMVRDVLSIRTVSFDEL